MSTYINSSVTAGYGLYYASQNPVTIGTSGYITNTNTSRFFGDAIYGSTAAAWSITNHGTVNARYGLSGGIVLAGGGTITNAAGAQITGVVDGISLSGSVGAVTNATGAVIAGNLNGIYFFVADGTISNSGAIEATTTNSHGIYLAALAVGADVTNAASGLITGGFDGVRVVANAGTVTNSGTIQATAAGGAGIALIGTAGQVKNYGIISGLLAGVDLFGAGGTVTNSGTIEATGSGTFSAGAYLQGGGVVSNNASAVLAGYRDGAFVQGVSAGLYGTVINRGTILGFGTGSDGVRLAAYGYVINQSGGLIRGDLDGVKINSSFGILSNDGTISGTGSHSTGAFFVSGGAVINNASALLNGYFAGAYVQGVSGADGVVTNGGTIEGIGTTADGVRLAAYGYVINQAGGLIRGGLDGVGIYSQYGILANSGTVSGTANAVVMNGGTVFNGGTAATSALVSGSVHGVFIGGTSGTVSNYGTIQGTGTLSDGVHLYGGGSIGNASSGVILGATNGAELDTGSGTIVNFGSIAGSGSGSSGVWLRSGGRVTNKSAGTIRGDAFGVLLSSGMVTNYGRVAATGATGIGIDLEFGTVTNFGLVTTGTSGTGIYLLAGNVTNSGTIVAPGASAVIVRYGTFFNYGVVEGAVSGIELSLGTGIAGTGEVKVSGTVSGTTGISVAPSGTADQTVTVAGSVVSTLGTVGKAVALGRGSDRLIVDPGAAFTGTVDGGGGTNVLEIAGLSGASSGGAGVVAAPSAAAYVSLGSVTNFSALEIDPSATFGGVGVLSFATLVNQGQINVGAGNSLALGVVVSAANAGVIDLQSGGTITFHGSVGNQTLLFQPPGGTALIDHPEAFLGTLSGFTTALDIVDLTTLNPVGASATLDAVSDRLVVTSGTQSVSLQLATGVDYTGITWQTSSDGGTGTDVAPVCFCRGTLIQTDRGEVPVEALAVGDRVVTLSGAARPIRWIGFGRDLVTRRHGLARPIVVRRGALADDVPRRDLHLTHGHALYLGGVLVPVENLVNHRTILWDEAARVVEYYHIELDDHDVLFAEGAPAESYYDAANRALFHNTRPGSEPGTATPTYAPVVTGGAAVERVWAQLYARAGGDLARNTTDDPDVHLVVDGQRLDPTTIADGVYRFTVTSAPIAALGLRSRRGVLSLVGIDRGDHRLLGVPITRIVLWHGGIPTSFDHDAPQLQEGGCHRPEDGYSWTDGELELPARFFTGLNAAFVLVVHTKRHFMRYPLPAASAAAA